MNEDKFIAALRAARVTNTIDPEDAAVFIADESGHPYDWRLIVDNRATYRQHLRTAERRLAAHPELHARLLDAKKALDRRHGL